MDGDPTEYLRHVVQRRDKAEVLNVLEAASLGDLEILFQLIVHPTHNLDYALLAIMSDFSNGDTVSLEKRALIRQFVDQNVSL